MKYGRPLSFQQMFHLTAYLARFAINKNNFRDEYQLFFFLEFVKRLRSKI